MSPDFCSNFGLGSLSIVHCMQFPQPEWHFCSKERPDNELPLPTAPESYTDRQYAPRNCSWWNLGLQECSYKFPHPRSTRLSGYSALCLPLLVSYIKAVLWAFHSCLRPVRACPTWASTTLPYPSSFLELAYSWSLVRQLTRLGQLPTLLKLGW